MKVSELVAILQECIEKAGDMNVVVRDIVNGEEYEICSVGAYPINKSINIEI